MRLPLALAVAFGCSKEAKQAVAKSIQGSKLEALSGSFDFLTSGGLSKLELVPTDTPSLKLAVDVAVGMITEGPQAEAILRAGDAEAICIGRAFLRDPNWARTASIALGQPMPKAPQYARA